MTAQSTYTPIATYTVSGTTTTAIVFSSIPQTYTDLVCVVYGRNSYASIATSQIIPQFNNDGAANYSYTYLLGNGGGAASNRVANTYYTYGGTVAGGAAGANIFGSTVFTILNYSNSTTYKSLFTKSAADYSTGGQTDMAVSTWRNTAAINSISFGQSYGTAYVAGTQATLYGITAA